MSQSQSNGDHLKALLNKNYILFKKQCCCACMEILVPPFFVLFLIAIRNLVPRELKPQKSYLSSKNIISKDITANAVTRTSYKSLSKVDFLAYQQYLSSQSMKDCFQTRQGGVIGISPLANDVDAGSITTGLQTEFAKMGYDVRFYSNKQAMDQYVSQDREYGEVTDKPYLCFGINIESASSDNYKYYLRFNISSNPTRWEVYNTLLPQRTSLIKTEDIFNWERYQKYGFLKTQNLIDNLILAKAKGDSNSYITANVAHQTLPNYLKDDMPSYLQGSSDFFLILPFIVPFMRNVYRLIFEKEKKLREGMKMMGMSTFSFYASWVIFYSIIYGLISFIMSVMLCLKIYPNSSFILLFLCIWLFGFCLIFQALFISVFFTNVKQGLIASMIFFIAFYMIRSLLQTSDVPTQEMNNQSSLSPHTAMTLIFNSFLQFESEGQGVTFDNFSVTVNQYQVSFGFFMLIINIIIYAIISIYLDLVFPNEFGNKKHPLFFLDYCRSNKIYDNLETKKNYKIEEQNPLNMEQVELKLQQLEESNECVKINNLAKVYPTGKVAVNNLNLNMYLGQIFVLLGHNGAGKTTTISMLSGLLNCTDGSATIFGKSISGQMEEIRKIMGICPQHDVLYDDLTVKEHLQLFATFKGMAKSEIPASIDKMIKQLDLVEKADYKASQLSGGQRRRLSVGLAFIGDSKLIILDEPTSGMDTSARRFIWELLKNLKSDRIIIITTHFMDEADFLGDRIGIMSDGKLVCCGSSLFLKNRFGSGYNLTVVKLDQSSNDSIIKFVRGYIPDAKIVSDVSAEISFNLPLNQVSNFRNLFENLDKNIEKLNIQSYGISITTLEEVFLKVAEESSDQYKERKLMKQQEMENEQQNKNKVLVEQIKLKETQNDDFQLESISVKNEWSVFSMHFVALLLKRWHYIKRDRKGIICEILVPSLVITFGLMLLTIQIFQTAPGLLMKPQVFDNVKLPITVYYGQNSGASANVGNLFTNFESSLTMTLNSAASDTDFDNYIFTQRSLSKMCGLWLSQAPATDGEYQYTLLLNSLVYDSAPVFLNAVNQAIIRKHSNKPSLSIEVINQPWPNTWRIQQFEKTADGFLSSLIFTIGLAFIPASLIVFLVKEKSENVKHQQIVCGVSIKAYWFSNFLHDSIKYFIPMVWCFLMTLAFNISIYTGDDNFGAFVLLHIAFGYSMISFTYLCTFVFKEYGTGQLVIFALFFLTGGIFPLLFFILRLIKSTSQFSKSLAWVLRFVPAFNYGYALISMSNKELYARTEGYKTIKNTYDFDIIGADIMMLFLTGTLYFLSVFFIEGYNGEFFQKKQSQYIPHDIDPDVKKEQELIAQTPPSGYLSVQKIAYQVYAKDLRKVYNTGKVAVDNLSVGVGNGEVFGLLGVNGAGKTTTFKMLCGEHLPSSGQIYICGYNVVTESEKIKLKVGYCPQFDALLYNLTCREHLELFSTIKRIPLEMREDLVVKKLKEMDLTKYEHVMAGTLSGGNKRKLSVAIAMMGNPPIVFLDEPSTGMDPGARRYMWDIISRISTRRKQSSIILTTHSMEEAEALATKIGIMVDGELKCLGSIQHIKNKFGKGYEIECKTNIPPSSLIDEIMQRKLNLKDDIRIQLSDIDRYLNQLDAGYLKSTINPDGYGSSLYLDLIKQNGLSIKILVQYVLIEAIGIKVMNFLEQNFKNFTILEHFSTFYRFKLSTEISIGQLFGQFEDNKEALELQNYSIRQASIEQIFNNFAQESANTLAKSKPQAIEMIQKQQQPDKIKVNNLI